MISSPPDLAAVVQEIAHDMQRRSDRGTVASYIPELANVDPARSQRRRARQ